MGWRDHSCIVDVWRKAINCNIGPQTFLQLPVPGCGNQTPLSQLPPSSNCFGESKVSKVLESLLVQSTFAVNPVGWVKCCGKRRGFRKGVFVLRRKLGRLLLGPVPFVINTLLETDNESGTDERRRPFAERG